MESLSNREMQIADLVHQGKIEKEIAGELYISLQTVRTHTKNIRRKLNARNIADITRIFLLELKPYSIAIIVAILVTILFHLKPELFESLKTSLRTLFK